MNARKFELKLMEGLKLQLTTDLSLCGWFNTSRQQRITEINQGLGLVGTSNYEHLVCYVCDGKYVNCENVLGD